MPLSGSFGLREIPNALTLTGSQIQTASNTAGVTEWWRPEDGAWDVNDPKRFYFVTTASVTGPSRLWALDFVDPTDPSKGGTFKALLDGTEGQKMFDNLTVAKDGKLILQEDVGNNARLGRVWVYDPASDQLNALAEHDPARFGTPPVAPFTQDEESSGVIDVTDIFGDANTQVFLLDVQAHYPFGAAGSADRTEVVEGGQLALMYVDRPRDGGNGDDLLNGGYAADVIRGNAGNDTIQGGSNADLLYGDAGNDVLIGGTGLDQLFGGGGSDILSGGLGSDTLSGSGGKDIFRYTSAAEGGDIITDFQKGVDQLEVSAAGFGGALAAGQALGTAQFRVADNNSAVGNAGQFIFQTNTRTLWWDADGAGAGAALKIASFDGLGGNGNGAGQLFSASDIVVAF